MRIRKLISRLMLIVQSFLRSLFQLRADFAVENQALRQQVATLKKENPSPQLTPFDRAFRVMHYKKWPRRKASLFVVKPETVVGWHRKGFRWPYTKQIVEALHAEGIVTWFHLDTCWDKNPPYFKELPRGSAVLALDGTTDIFTIRLSGPWGPPPSMVPLMFALISFTRTCGTLT